MQLRAMKSLEEEQDKITSAKDAEKVRLSIVALIVQLVNVLLLYCSLNRCTVESYDIQKGCVVESYEAM